MAVALARSSASLPAHDDAAIRHELQSINLFRVLESLVIVSLMLSPYAVQWVYVEHRTLGSAIALIYFAFALTIWTLAARDSRHFHLWINVSLIVDIAAITLAMATIHGQFFSLALLLLVNLGSAAILLPRRLSFFYAALATLGVLAQCVAGNFIDQDGREIVEAGICGLAYFVVTGLCTAFGRRMHETATLADRRSHDLVDLASFNELIIQHMKTGVMVVDGHDIVRQRNEVAVALLGNPAQAPDDLASLAPDLARRLYRWRTTQSANDTPLALSEGARKVIPRFARMSAHDDENTLIFLDDAAPISRHAEQISLAATDRLAASIAHEIRNPLAAIAHAAQLLGESAVLPVVDLRLIEIIRNHVNRANEIIENVLHLARRERSMPECVDLAQWIERFAVDFATTTDLGANTLTVDLQAKRADILVAVDPRQLHQVVWNLVQNALRYGHRPGEPAHIAILARAAGERGLPMLDVVDHGPGIAPNVVERIFEPFYTTHELGTGLGLYLARELCVANLATLEYVPPPGGGACFRITFALPSGRSA